MVMSGYDQLDYRVQDKLSIAEFMLQNFEKDPDFFVEPEDTSDYGPPGMPTPFVPMDARIAERQMNLSDSLRELLLNPDLREHLGEDTIEMLKMNFDAHNTILGVTNNGSYYRWTHQEHPPTLPSDLKEVEERAILGLAQPGEILDLLLFTQDDDCTDGDRKTEDLKSAELMKLYHPAKYRMRHLEPRREEIKAAILERGGEVAEKPDFYDLTLFPYVVVTVRDLTDEERRECYMLQKSSEMKLKILNAGKSKTDDEIKEDAVIPTPELIDEMIAEIHRAGHRVNEILAGTQTHTIKGLMASVKRRIGVIRKDADRDIRVVERQVFAMDITDFDDELIDALHYVRAARDENEGKEKPAVDEKTVAVYAHVYEHFKNNTDKILPVSTATYGYEKPHVARFSETVTGAIARIATQSSVSIS